MHFHRSLNNLSESKSPGYYREAVCPGSELVQMHFHRSLKNVCESCSCVLRSIVRSIVMPVYIVLLYNFFRVLGLLCIIKKPIVLDRIWVHDNNEDSSSGPVLSFSFDETTRLFINKNGRKNSTVEEVTPGRKTEQRKTQEKKLEFGGRV